jgi:hypothetical protein
VWWCPTHVVLCFCFVFVFLCTLSCQFLWIVHWWFPFRYSLTFLFLGSRQIHVYSTITKHFCCHNFGFVCLFVINWTSIFYLLNIITGKNQFQVVIHDTIISIHGWVVAMELYWKIEHKYCMTLWKQKSAVKHIRFFLSFITYDWFWLNITTLEFHNSAKVIYPVLSLQCMRMSAVLVIILERK